MSEIWKSVEGHERLLEVSSFGNVRTLDRLVPINGGHKLEKGKILTLRLKKNGYLQVAVRFGNGNRKWFLVHRLVAIAFLPNPDKLSQVDHVNNDKADNKVVNLQWMTSKANCNKAYKDGMCSNEEKHYKAKLTKEQVIEIRNITGMLHREIASLYGVSRSTITVIRASKTWKYAEIEQ